MNASKTPLWKGALSWIKKQYETPVQPGYAETSAPSSVEIIPGELSVLIYRHDVEARSGAVPCWTYVSSGLQRYQQFEIALTLVRQARETPPPEEPLTLIRTINDLAQAGRLVFAGGVSEFGGAKFLGGHIAYLPAQTLPGVPIPANALCAILLTDEELVTAKSFGITRVMARLGQAFNYYPCPPWADPARTSLAFAETNKQTALANVARLRIPGCRVYKDEVKKHVVLVFRRGSGEIVTKRLAEVPSNIAFAFLSEFDPDADGCLVWQPGQSAPTAITPEGSNAQRVCGCFLMLAVNQAEDRVLIHEDGFGAILTQSSWHAMKEALRQEQTLEITTAGRHMGLVLDWSSDTLSNPVDGTSSIGKLHRSPHPPSESC